MENYDDHEVFQDSFDFCLILENMMQRGSRQQFSLTLSNFGGFDIPRHGFYNQRKSCWSITQILLESSNRETFVNNCQIYRGTSFSERNFQVMVKHGTTWSCRPTLSKNSTADNTPITRTLYRKKVLFQLPRIPLRQRSCWHYIRAGCCLKSFPDRNAQ